MDESLSEIVLILGVLVLLLVIGTEVAFSIAGAALLGFILIDQSFLTLSLLSWAMSKSFILIAIPLFLFLGNVFLYSGVTSYLFDAILKWLGWLPAGLGCSVIGACAMFAAISGSSPATAATIGSIALPEMRKQRYDDKLACGIIAAGGTLGILIPPSITMVIYGAWQGVSVVKLFAGGIIPAIILAFLFMTSLIIRVRLKPMLAPKRVAFSWRERFRAVGKVLPWLLLIAMILGGIFAGIMTPTEAAGIGALLSLVFAAAYRKLSFKVLNEALTATLKVTSMIIIIIAMARVLAFYVHWLGIGKILTTNLLDLNLPKYGILIAIYCMYILLGMFFETASMIVLTMPFVAPILTTLGLDLVWFGIVLVILMEAGMITPPVGINLYVVQGIAKKDIIFIAQGATIFFLAMLVVVGILTVFPNIVLWLPSVMFG